MKRLIAVLLALSMTFYVAPLNAIAATNDSFSQTITVNSQPDADLVQAIASDPFLTQANSAQQEQSGTVDTSNVSMEATNSFGKLLLNGMDEENSSSFSSNNRIIDIKMNGNTATVKYLVEEDADLVVGIYADDAEEEMIASGTVAVTKTSNGTATVKISGNDIPDYYVIKGYLFDKTEHAPLCDPFKNISNTKNMVDLDSATINDFDEERVINLDDKETTNFAVVSEEVTLLTAEDAGAGKNDIIDQDNDGLNYTISNASDEIKNLQVGDILTYEYAPGEMLIVRVSAIETSGDTVTIHGDDTLEVEDVFDVIKIEADANTEEFQFEEADGFTNPSKVNIDDSIFEGDSDFSIKSDVSTENSLIDETNSGDHQTVTIAMGWGFSKTVSSSSGGASASATVSGNLTISATADLEYKLFKENGSDSAKYLNFTLEPKVVADFTISGQAEDSIDMPAFGATPVPGVYIGCNPKFNIRAEVQLTAVATAKAKIGFGYDGSKAKDDRIKNLSESPTFKVEASIDGSLYVGIDFAPNIALLGFIKGELTAEIGATAKIHLRAEASVGGSSSHGCSVCYSGDISVSIYVKATLVVIFPLPGKELLNTTKSLGKFYWSPEYDDFGWGDCPHTSSDKPSKPDTPDEPETPDIPTGGTVIASGVCGENGKNPTWTLDDNGVLTISGKGKMKNYSSGSAPWHDAEYIDKVEYVLIKDGVTGIGNSAFSGCDSIVAVAIPKSVKSIGEYAFYKCVLLEGVTIPSSVTSIGSYAFSQSGLESITVPGSVTSMGNGVFYECSSLSSAVMLKGVQSISTAMFSRCDSLTSVTIPDSVTSIGGGSDNWGGAFAFCTSLTNVEIPSSVTSIGGYAFYRCTSLADATICEGVTSIGYNAFDLCTSLTSVTIPASVKTIGNYAFSGCSGLTSVTLNKGLTTIGNNAFYKCTALTDITIPESVTKIDSYAFQECSALTNVEILEGVPSIGSYAFSNCISLANVTIPKSVTSINNNAFSNCTSLTSVTIPNSVTRIGDYAFSNSGLTSITVPGSVTSMGYGVFYECGSLSSAVMLKGVQSISTAMFNRCDSLTSVTIPDSVTSIGGGSDNWGGAFALCTSLTSIEIPSSVTSIGGYAFYRCTSLADATICEGVTSIGYHAFDMCTSLTSVTIPASVKTIGGYAFDGSEASIHFAGTKAQWKAISLPTSKDDRLVSTTIHCVDGDIVPGEESDDENSITTGKADTRDNKRYAVFNGLTAGKSYAVIVSKSSTNPFDANNLIYVNQREAKANGVLEVPFISSETGATYVVACSDEPEQILYTATIEADGQVTTIKAAAGDTISIEAKETANDGKTFQTWKVVKGDVKLENAKSRKTTFVMATEDIKITAIYEKSASSSGDSSSGGSSSGTTKPDKPGSGSSSGSGSSGSSGSSSSSSSGSASSGGSSSSSSGSSSSSSSSSSSNNNDGGGAIVAVVLIGGAAIATVTAGVILMMPVEVSGVAQLDDGTVLANVTVQLMKDGKLAAQTMTDESGHFALEVKRGEYTLNMITTHPETGEQIVRTDSIKAPMKNTSFVF